MEGLTAGYDDNGIAVGQLLHDVLQAAPEAGRALLLAGNAAWDSRKDKGR